MAVLATLGLVRLWRKKQSVSWTELSTDQMWGNRKRGVASVLHARTSTKTNAAHHPGALNVLRKGVNNIMIKPCARDRTRGFPSISMFYPNNPIW